MTSRNRPTVPTWIPDLEVLTLGDPEGLFAWLGRRGVDFGYVSLARCGEPDCFVIGLRDGAASQLWIHKDEFRILRARTDRREVLFEEYRSWGRVVFPSRIRIVDDVGELALLEVTYVGEHPLTRDDFSPEWVSSLDRRTPQARQGRARSEP